MPAFHYYHPIEVRYGDLDPQGHVNNARYLTYLEQARVAYFGRLGLWDGRLLHRNRIGIILADAHVTFKAPILLGQDLRVGLRVSRLGHKSLTMEYCLEDGETGQELAQASTVLVAYEYESGRTIPLPDEWREAITAFEGPSLNS
jgi:acyl-CoA thioester hydrolase